MPLEGNHANDIGLETADGLVCKFDTADGKIKSPEKIFEGGVAFFTETVTKGDRNLALYDAAAREVLHGNRVGSAKLLSSLETEFTGLP